MAYPGPPSGSMINVLELKWDDFGWMFPYFFYQNLHKKGATSKDPHVDTAKATDFGIGFEVLLSILKLERLIETY